MVQRAREKGDVLDERYRLVEPLGQGGFGDVWRAEELLPDGKPLREVALKLLVRAVATDWAEEARLIAALRHAALVTVYAAGLLDTPGGAVPFVAMELLRGASLASLVDAGCRLSWRRALKLALEVAAALDEIHRAGVVHLDLKPANLFLTATGLKVLDFGISQQADTRRTPAVEGHEPLATAAFILQGEFSMGEPGAAAAIVRTVVGTPGFMAPEVLDGGEPTPAADAYALASCVVLLVTGRLPQDVPDRPPAEPPSGLYRWLSEVQTATLHGRLRPLLGLSGGAAVHGSSSGFPPGFRELLLRWLRLDPVLRGVPPGSLKAQLDGVWMRPYGASPRPFPGLRPFGEETEGNFHGRDRESERLSRELIDQPCMILHAQSGTGLTSLALAGLVPGLAKNGADGRENWTACHVRLGEAPDREFSAGIDAWLGASAPSNGVGVGASDGDPSSAIRHLQNWASQARDGVVLVVEDLGAALDVTDGATGFWLAMNAIVSGIPGVRILGLLRDEKLAGLMANEARRALRSYVRFVGAASWSAAEELVRDPARLLGIALEGVDDVVAEVKAELGRDGASFGAISLALASWWDGPLDAASWAKQGGVLGPLVEHAERIFGALTAADATVPEWILSRLLRADGTAVEGSAVALSEAHATPARVVAALRMLNGARLVRVHGDAVNLVHPVLMTRWTRLSDLRLRDLPRMLFLEDLRATATRWRDGGALPAELWTSEKLTQFDGRFGLALPDLNSDERAFVGASRKRLRRRLVGRILGVLGLLGLVFGAVGFENARRARVAVERVKLQAANHAAAVERLMTSSRRTSDPYRRLALLGAAIREGSTDPLIGFEMLGATRGLPSAKFLRLDPLQSPRFPWNGKFILGHTRDQVVLFDLLPDEGSGWGPVEMSFSAHQSGLHDVEAFRFGSGFVTRGLDGTLRVWRVRENREVALAAESPMPCVRGLSRVLVASAAPVLTCVTTDAIARWDLRDPARADTMPFAGRLLAISADGESIAAARQSRVVVWRRGHSPTELVMPAQGSAIIAAFSPSEPVIAVVDSKVVLVFDLSSGTPSALAAGRAFEHRQEDPVEAHFADGGFDLAVCDADGYGRWTYLRRGERAPSDGPAPGPKTACGLEASAPERLHSSQDYESVLGDGVSLGPREFDGGWRLGDGRLVTRDLVLFTPLDRSLAKVTSVGAVGSESSAESLLAFVRSKELLLAQFGEELRAMNLDGEPLWSRKARLLSPCADGRVLAWRKDDDEATWSVLDAAREVVVKRVVRSPGFILGVEPSCTRLFVQSLEGQVSSVVLTGGSSVAVEPTPIAPAAGGYASQSYVFDVRPSVAAGEYEAGLWLAFGSGAMVRASANGTLVSYGYAAPRATAMADGAHAGELLFADESGVAVRSNGNRDNRFVGPMPGREWSDLYALPGSERVLLSWVDGLAIADLKRGELLGWTGLEGRGRISPWDEQGSVMAWSFAQQGPLRAELVPLGKALAEKVTTLSSNLSAELDALGNVSVHLR